MSKILLNFFDHIFHNLPSNVISDSVYIKVADVMAFCVVEVALADLGITLILIGIQVFFIFIFFVFLNFNVIFVLFVVFGFFFEIILVIVNVSVVILVQFTVVDSVINDFKVVLIVSLGVLELHLKLSVFYKKFSIFVVSFLKLFL